MMSLDRRKLYQDPKAFFDLDGNAVMKLTRGAAIEACRSVAERAIIIVRIEGGISSGAKFEARRDAIWDGLDPPIARNEAQENNLRGADFIKSMDACYNAFILTSLPVPAAHTGRPEAVPRRTDNWLKDNRTAFSRIRYAGTSSR